MPAKRTKSSSPSPPRPLRELKPPRKGAAYELRLYIAGKTPRAAAALENLQRICEEHLPGQYQIEVIDLIRHPKLGRGDQIVAVPTLVRKLPEPVRKIIGDLSNREKVLVGLDLRSRATGGTT